MKRSPDKIVAQVRLRSMTAKDGPAMARLCHEAVFAVPRSLASPEARESWASAITPDGNATAEAVGRETFLIAELDGVMVGFASCALNGEVGEITGHYVAGRWQRHGIGRRLAERCEAVLRGHGAETLRVRSGLAGMPAYAALGFIEVSRTIHRTPDGRETPRVIMEKALSGGWRNFYGRRHGKTLRSSQRTALARLAELSPGPVSHAENPERCTIDLSRFGDRPLWLEIGFGGGEHLVHQARRRPDVQFIGAEPFVNGVAMLLSKIDAADLDNISVHKGDARDLVEVLPASSISRTFLLYPDPWPKRRHHRRRFVTSEHLVPLARVMAEGAEFRIATDIPDYVRQARAEVPRHGFVEETADETAAWPDWTRTRYEAKALREGRRPHYLTFRRG